MSLANKDENFVSPAVLRTLAKTKGWYMTSIAKRGDYIYCEDINPNNIPTVIQEYCSNNNIQVIHILKDIPILIEKGLITNIDVWGWDWAIRKLLINTGISKSMLPTDAYLERLHYLSSRERTIEAINWINNSEIQNRSKNFKLLTPTKITSLTEAHNFAEKYRNVVFKSPWSGSGRGLRWCRKDFSHSDTGWCQNILKKHGFFMAEKRYSILQDFAMEFISENRNINNKNIDNGNAEDGDVKFLAYSIFNTNGGAYLQNLDISEKEKVELLSHYMPTDELNQVKEKLRKFLKQLIYSDSQSYTGIISIDMFFHKSGFYPICEINFRQTMGNFSNRFYEIGIMNFQKL